MKRSLFILSGLTAAIILAGCATQPTPPSSAATGGAGYGPTPAAASTAAPAAPSDADIAAKLKGEWTGEWIFPGYGTGKFVFIGTSAEGNTMKGEAQLFGTAAGDLKLPLSKAVVEKGVLKANAPDLEFTLTMKSDTELAGKWYIKGYMGDLKVKR